MVFCGWRHEAFWKSEARMVSYVRCYRCAAERFWQVRRREGIRTEQRVELPVVLDQLAQQRLQWTVDALVDLAIDPDLHALAEYMSGLSGDAIPVAWRRSAEA